MKSGWLTALGAGRTTQGTNPVSYEHSHAPQTHSWLWRGWIKHTLCEFKRQSDRSRELFMFLSCTWPQSSVAGGSVLRLTLTGYWCGIVGRVSSQVLCRLRGGLWQPLRAAAVTDAVGKQKCRSTSLPAIPTHSKLTCWGQDQEIFQVRL